MSDRTNAFEMMSILVPQPEQRTLRESAPPPKSLARNPM
jgi:hypothetical protein